MNEGNVRILGMNYVHITACEINKSVNSHGNAIIKGYIEEENLAKCKNDAISDKWLALQIYEEDFNTAFSGNIKSFEIKYINDYYEVELELIGETSKMDLVERIRIFQSGSTMVEKVLEIIDGRYSALHILEEVYSKPLGKMTVQYKETDWEFVKRIISEKHGYVIPYYKEEGCRYIVGVNEENPIIVNMKTYKIKDNPKLYNYKIKNGIQVECKDEQEYIFKGKEIYEIGSPIIFNGLKLYIHAVNSVMVGSDIMNTYYLKSKIGFKEVKINNYKIIGASLLGNVTEVKNDVVYVNFSNLESYGSRTYPYSTVYSSKDGAGWYCMPEVGDSVRVYFPTENCNDAYTISSEHIQMGDKTPSTKFLRNPQNKEIMFSESQLKITNNAGLDIILDDEKGIEISSNKAIRIGAKELIQISSNKDKIVVDAKSQIMFLQGDSKISVDDNVNIVGKQVHVQNN